MINDYRVYKGKRWNAEKIAEFFKCSLDTATFLFGRWETKKIKPSDLFEYEKESRYIVYVDKLGNKFDSPKIQLLTGLTIYGAQYRLRNFKKNKINIDGLLGPSLKRIKMEGDEKLKPIKEISYKGKMWGIKEIQAAFGCGDEVARYLRRRCIEGHFSATQLFEYEIPSRKSPVKHIYTDKLGNKFDYVKIMKLTGRGQTTARQKILDAIAGKLTIDELLAPPILRIPSSKKERITNKKKSKYAFREEITSERQQAFLDLQADWLDTPVHIKEKDEEYFGHVKPQKPKKYGRMGK